MRGSIATRPGARTAAPLAAVLLIGACAAPPQLGLEAPGRPAVTWHGAEGEAEAPAAGDGEDRLLADVQAAERSGPDTLALAQALYNLAILRRRQGELEDAAQLYQRALAIRERKQGPEHPDVAATLNNLAGIEAAQGHYDDAQQLLERAVRIREATLGPAHTLTAQSLSNLALLYAAQGNAAAAEPLYQRSLAILEQAETTESGDLVRVLDNYAALLRDTGRDAEAEEIEARARVRRPPAAP